MFIFLNPLADKIHEVLKMTVFYKFEESRPCGSVEADLPGEVLGRPVLFATLVGSHTYNLNTPASDRDYHLFVCPTFDDLYRGDMLTKQFITEAQDLAVYDVRRIPELLWKSNPSFIDVMFSKQILIKDPITGNRELDGSITKEILSMFELREPLARMNLPYFWDACIGIFMHKTRNFVKGTSGTVDLVQRYGYDTKQVMHALRGLWVLQRYADNGFTLFRDATWFEGADRDYMLSVRNGAYGIQDAIRAMDEKLTEVQRYEPMYKGRAPDADTRDALDGHVRRVIEEMTLDAPESGRGRVR